MPRYYYYINAYDRSHKKTRKWRITANNESGALKGAADRIAQRNYDIGSLRIVERVPYSEVAREKALAKKQRLYEKRKQKHIEALRNIRYDDGSGETISYWDSLSDEQKEAELNPKSLAQKLPKG